MDVFNLITGLVTIASLLFGMAVHFVSRRNAAVERERNSSVTNRLTDLLGLANAIARQGTLIGSMADREETTKKELKHLAVALLTTIDALQNSLSEEHASRVKWKFGVPSEYVRLQAESRESGSEE